MEQKRWTEEDVLKLQALVRLIEVESLDRVIISEGEEVGELSNLVPDTSPGPQEIVEDKDRVKILLEYVDKLEPRENKVIRMRYGLDDGNFRTLDEVGQYFGVSRERIRQIEMKAIKKLKWLMTVKGHYRDINDI